MRRFLFSLLCVATGFTLVGAPTVSAQTLSNDPFVQQWGYQDTGVYDAWDHATGSSAVVVAIIDDGFDSYHPDLQDNVWKNTHEIPDNGQDDDHNGYIDDVFGWNFSVEDTNGNGAYEDSEQVGDNDPRPSVLGFVVDQNIENSAVNHGTLVAGIIGAVGNNGVDGAGINWQVKLMNLKVIGNSGTGVLLGLPRAIHYAVDNGADVINMSLVGSEDPEVELAVKYAYDHGVAVVAAAGNDLLSLNEVRRDPVCADAGQKEQWVLGVSAIGEDHRIARFSNYGSDCIDLAAPGVGISSTVRYAPAYGLRDEYSGHWQGTSFAAPFVSGAAALLKSIQPTWKAADIYQAILSTTHKTPPKDEAEYAQLFGAGLLQIQKAVEYALARPRIIPSHRELQSVIAVAPKTGSVVLKNFTQMPELPAREVKALATTADMAAFRDKGKSMVAVLSYPNKSTLKVTVYNDWWTPTRSWTLPVKGTWRLAAGDVTGDSAPEIVLAPAAGDTTLVRVFSTTGKEIKNVKQTVKHGGVLALSLASTSSTNDIVVVYRDGTKNTLSRISGRDWKTPVRFTLLNTQAVLAVAAADAEGDGVDDYVVLTRPGTVDVAIYTATGEATTRFTAYDSAAVRDVSLVVADYDGDGVDDFLTSPWASGQPVRVWSTRVRVIEEWWPFGETTLTGARLLPLYMTGK